MERITVDPEMKSRVMSAVSAAIKEQSANGTVVSEIPKKSNSGKTSEQQPVRRKKANRTPIIVVSSLVAVVIIFIGIAFVMKYMGASSATHLKNETNGAYSGGEAAGADSGNYAADTQPMYDDAMVEFEETTNDDTDKNLSGDNGNSFLSTGENNNYTITIDDDFYTRSGNSEEDASEGMGDARRDKISRTLPFDLKGIGTGEFADGIDTEVFIGEMGDKAVVLSAAEGTDLVKAFYPANKADGELTVTPDGTAVKLYRLPFGNVLPLDKDETSTDVNAAFYSKDGKTYLLVFSNVQTPEDILRVVDAI